MPAIRVSGPSIAYGLGKLCLFLLAAGAASAQIYPPIGYPGGGYPAGGIPIPGRNGKAQPNSSTKGQPLPSFHGKLKQMDNKSILLALDDERLLNFTRDSKTKFFKDGQQIKDPKFNVNDDLTIEGPEDNAGFLTAVNVYWEKAAGSATASTKSTGDKVPDAWADAPAQAHSTDAAPPPAKHDSDDPGPPTLTRGQVSDPSREKSAPLPPDAATTTGSLNRPTLDTADGHPDRLPQIDPDHIPAYRPRDDMSGDSIPRSLRYGDDLIRRTADTALDFTSSLPNYVCTELMSRYESETKPANWHAIDVVGTEVVYQDGKEDYRKVTLNGRPINKKIEELNGSWSTGEFGTILIDLFSPSTSAEFHYVKDSRSSGITTKQYDYTVQHANSHWQISIGGQKYNPGYTGTVWIDPANARVMRIEMSARSFPSGFATDDVESATDYEYVRLGDAKQYLLPVHAETLSCNRGSNDCSRNAIDFRNYRKYTGESTITFDDPIKK